jgi:hypothetical protein
MGFQITMVIDGAVDFMESLPERRVLLRQSCRPRWVVGANTGGLELFGYHPFLHNSWIVGFWVVSHLRCRLRRIFACETGPCKLKGVQS